jgi:CNT family concentrative nucleoside transporter
MAPDPQTAQSALGILAFPALAWAMGEDRRRFPWRIVVAGLGLQLALALALLKLPVFKGLFLTLNEMLGALERATQAGTGFVFGYLGGGPAPFAVTDPGSSFVLAFRALPLVLVVSALSSLLFYWRVLPWVVRLVSRLLRKVMGIGGAVGLSAAADIFVGMVEAPLFVRPYLAAMSRGELFSVMTCGMATIAGTVMALYASFLANVVPDAMGHILTASLVSMPGALLIAALMVPAGESSTVGSLTPPRTARSGMDAVIDGTLAGVALLINILAMLVVFVALVSLANMVLGLLPDHLGQPLTLQRVLGWLMAPVAWLTGIPWSEAVSAGALLGTKTVLNELIAYLDLARLPPEALSSRSELIMTYALCGFANLGSLGILIGGLSTMVPERREEIVALGPRAIVSGTLATLLTGAVVGVLTV